MWWDEYTPSQQIFKDTDLPYKKAKKLVTGCNKTCCRRPLMALFNMVEFGEVDYEEIAFLIDAKNDRLKDDEWVMILNIL